MYTYFSKYILSIKANATISKAKTDKLMVEAMCWSTPLL